MLDGVKIGILGVLTLLLAMAANYGQDQVYTFHALLLTAIAAIAMIWTIRNAGSGRITKAVPETGYMDEVVRYGVIATAFWGVVGFLVGTYIAFQLAFPVLNLDLPWTQLRTAAARCTPRR